MTLEYIMDQIASDEYKVISFDIFDTLLLRPSLEPTDILSFVGKRGGFTGNFLEMRKLSERLARKNKPVYNDEIELDDIYKELTSEFNISQDLSCKLKQIEIQVETDYLYCRKAGKALFDCALQAGKEVIIVSDMYLPEYVIRDILKKNGYEGFSKLYLSSTYKIMKSSGRLYNKIFTDFEMEGILPNQILHIGDNDKSDYNIPRTLGMAAIHLPRTTVCMRRSRRLGVLFNNLEFYSDNTFLIGYAANEIFDNPFVEYNYSTCFNGNRESLTAFLLAPFVLSFVKWMLEDSIKEKLDTLCLVYRDGYLIEKVIDLLSDFYSNIPECRKLYLTRALMYKFYASKDHGFFNALFDMRIAYPISVDLFIKERLCAENDEQKLQAFDVLKKYGYRNLDDKINSVLDIEYMSKEIEPLFCKYAAPQSDVIREYCKNILKDSGKLGVYDVGYRGRVCKFLKEEMGYDSIEYHLFGKEEQVVRNLEGYCLKVYHTYGMFTERDTMILNTFIEDFLNSPESSVNTIKKEGSEFAFLYDNYKEGGKDVIITLQESTLLHIQKIIKKFSSDLSYLNFDNTQYFEFLKRFLSAPAELDARLLENITYKDSSFMNSSSANLYKNWKVRKCPVKKIITYNNIEKFKNVVRGPLETVHLLSPAKKTWNLCKRARVIMKNMMSKNVTSHPLKDSMDRAILDIKKGVGYRLNKHVIFVGHMVAFDKGSCAYINKIMENFTDVEYHYLSVISYIGKIETQKKIHCDATIMPKSAFDRCYDKYTVLPVTEEQRLLIANKDYLQEALEIIKARFKDMGQGYAENLVCFMYRYFEEFLNIYNLPKYPATLIVWNQFTPTHHILINICKEKNIRVLFMEFGVIPGTFVIESHGQMGESSVAIDSQNFQQRFITKEEFEQADRILKILKANKLNRNIQPVSNELDRIKKANKEKRKVITYFGQNDYESGLFPYTQRTEQYHSPIFKSSDEAAAELATIAKENNWFLVYKPHPTIASISSFKSNDANVFIADKIDINELIDYSDVTLTILSQAAYISLIRGCPTIMLGFNQLYEKGCTYENYDKNNITKSIQTALKYGYTEAQKEAFIKHVAQLLKYYLFRDYLSDDCFYGQPVENLRNIIFNFPRTEDADIALEHTTQVAIISTMPANYYSGGRSHAWNIAEALVKNGNNVYFIANNRPIFQNEMSENENHENIHFIETPNFDFNQITQQTFDYVFLIPHRSSDEEFYIKVRDFAIYKNAKLVLLNFESYNWFHKYVQDQLSEDLWRPWLNTCQTGCMVLCSAYESMKYAKEYYTINPQYTKFSVWYPPINSFVANKVENKTKENRIVTLIRLNDKYKGSYDVLDIIDEHFKDFTFVFIYGSGLQDEKYKKYVERLEQIKLQYNVKYEIICQPTDYQKFEEIKRAKILLFPSYFEGYGTPPIEALYCNTICIAYDLPVLRETCGEELIYCKYGSAYALKNSLIKAISLPLIDSHSNKRVQYLSSFDIRAEELNGLLMDWANQEWRDPMDRHSF